MVEVKVAKGSAVKKQTAEDKKSSNKNSLSSTKKISSKKPVMKVFKDVKKDSSKEKVPVILVGKRPEKMRYSFAGKESLSAIIARSIPKEFIPTKRVAKILSVIFLTVIILGIFQFPLNEMLAGNTDATVKVGIPWTFMEFGITTIDSSPLRVKGLILDLLFYILVSYIIEVLINMVLNSRALMSKDDKARIPKVYKDAKGTIADKLTKKAFGGENLKEVKEEEKSTLVELKPEKSKPIVKTVTKPVQKNSVGQLTSAQKKPAAKPIVKPIQNQPLKNLTKSQIKKPVVNSSIKKDIPSNPPRTSKLG